MGRKPVIGRNPEKAVCKLRRHESGDLLEVISLPSGVLSEWQSFVVRKKRLRQ